MVHVNQMLYPGTRVLDRLRPVIQKELTRRRETIKEAIKVVDSLLSQGPPIVNTSSPPPPFDPYFYGSGEKGLGAILSEIRAAGPKDEAPEEN
jgi:hypothetical protein